MNPMNINNISCLMQLNSKFCLRLLVSSNPSIPNLALPLRALALLPEWVLVQFQYLRSIRRPPGLLFNLLVMRGPPVELPRFSRVRGSLIQEMSAVEIVQQRYVFDFLHVPVMFANSGKPVSQPSNMDEGAAGPSTNPPKRSMSNTPQQSAQINDQPDEQFAYGARLLEQFGWSRGLPLGRSMQGLSTALHTPEQRNYRHGLGFCGNWDALNTPLTEEELKFERNRPMIFCPSDELRQNNAEIAYAIYVAISQSKSKSVHLRIRGLPKDATGFELYDAESLISANIRLLARATAIAERTRPGSTTSKQFRFTTDRTNNVELDTPELWADALKEASYSAAQELEAQLAVEEGVDPHGLAWSWDESDNQSNTEPGEADLSAQLLEEELVSIDPCPFDDSDHRADSFAGVVSGGSRIVANQRIVANSCICTGRHVTARSTVPNYLQGIVGKCGLHSYALYR